jgi:small subunit ribosomal protein S1
VGNSQGSNGQGRPDPKEETTEGRTKDDLRELVEESFQALREGDIVRGTVVAVTDDHVVVDIGYKSEGMIPRSEFTDRQGRVTVKEGDEVDVFVERFDEMLGEIRLSRERAARLRVWEVLEAAYRDGSPVRGRVVERVKGGLSVDIGVRAFLPGSLVDLRPSRRLEDYIGEEIEARIINFDRRRANVVLSRKAILEEHIAEQKGHTLANLEEGSIVTGTVKNITDYGVFIDVGGIDGLLHVTDISWGRVGHPSEYFKVGEEVKVVVVRIDRERERISLGYRQRFEDPWSHVEATYPVGKKVQGKVTNVVDYGAFVQLEEGVEGLIHVSEMSWTKKIKNPKTLLQPGQDVGVVITEVDVDKRRISLSLRQTEPNPWEDFATRHRVGSRVKGVVRNLTDFGAFVELEPGIDGLIHVSDMSWSRRISHPSEVVQKGQEIETMVIGMDAQNQRISLSLKELLPNEWDEFASSHQVGDEVEGFVTNVTDFGLFIELAPGVEGLCHISEIERLGSQPLAEVYSRGQRVRTRLIRVDWNEKRIGLSLRGIPQPEPEQELEPEQEPADVQTPEVDETKEGPGAVPEGEAGEVGEAESEPTEIGTSESEEGEGATAEQVKTEDATGSDEPPEGELAEERTGGEDDLAAANGVKETETQAESAEEDDTEKS